MKPLALALFLLVGVISSYSQSIEDEWIFSVAYINNESTGGAGTGFFVGREFETNKTAIFLVSNRHVLAPRQLFPGETNGFAQANVVITREENGQLSTAVLKIRLRETNSALKVVTHPNPNIDIAVLNVGEYVLESLAIRKGYKVEFVPEWRFVTKETVTNTHVTIGQNIIMLGYPLNLLEGKTAIAVARSGVIATPAERDFRDRPVFLVDSAAIRGSSGSPVFLPLRTYKIVKEINGNKNVNNNGGYTPGLLGIAAETVPDWELVLNKTETFGFPPKTISVMTTANLGIVFRADMISETLDATGCPKTQRKGQTEY